MMKKIIGIFVCMLMICGALVSANNVTKNKQGFNIEDGAITVNIPVGGYKINDAKQWHEVTVEGYGRLLHTGKTKSAIEDILRSDSTRSCCS